MLELVPDWRSYLREPFEGDLPAAIHGHMRTGRPLGTDVFIEHLERCLGRPLRRKKPGPKPRQRDPDTFDVFSSRDGG
ncbi:MAG: hypothetical protein U9Q81_10750 [Pseudomonadota bacterium]|nr:hypothetical protein [Pseudomonadota bacterium]